MSYSGGGGALTLPSPTHVHHHHVDVSSAVRSLRRSLSRSPSKFRLITKSPSLSPKSPLSPSPLSPQKRSSSTFNSHSNPPHTPSPLAVPFPPSAKLALRSSSRVKSTPVRPASRRTSPKSPMKRALSRTVDDGNATPYSSTTPVGGQENRSSTSPADRKSLERGASRVPFNMSDAPMNQALSRLGGDGASETPSTSSPLKRSDAIMNLDRASLGSPVAKRRSLHGSASFGHDFDVFDHGPTTTPSFDIHDDSGFHEYELSTASITSDTSSPFTSMPRRSSSLRKSTLQQRHGEKTSWGRRHAAQVLQAQHQASLAQNAAAAAAQQEMSTPVQSKNRPRLSLDQFMPPMPRDSPFSNQASLPNPSMHMLNQPTHQREAHPLSRTMTTSSSGSSMVEESPTRVPINFGEQTRPKIDFSKSLPAGSLRPFALDVSSSDGNSGFETPNYKSAKPLPSAFATTGLLSKVNRNPEQAQPGRGGKGVPDTPCKKPHNVFATYPAPIPGSAIAKARHIRHSFGTPSTTFNPNSTQQSTTPGTFGKPNSIFGGVFGKSSLSRRGSFLSVDGDEGESQTKDDFELPPTPTKGALFQRGGSPSSHRGFSASTSAVGYELTKRPQRTTSTSPLERIEFMQKLSPRTPHDSMTPPDPSGLSISNHRENFGFTMLPPATPTAGRDYFSKAAARRMSTTPVSKSCAPPPDIEESISARFDRVELIGHGQFSDVYRVVKTSSAPRNAFFFGGSQTPGTPGPERVYAVKKSRQPFQGTRDRERKLQEVKVLSALRQSDHVVTLEDSWEDKNYLYIQTEYCEEGSLDHFIAKAGSKGKLDDFRIWKMLLELCLGLQTIHDSDYLHLDIKPANILITFEGVLKIADFGMSTSWPAPPGNDGEGDRQYMAPEVLNGRLDKPADIFALGMMMLEIAGNVVLPDNGDPWSRLRCADWTDWPAHSLTYTNDSTLSRDAAGNPMDDADMTSLYSDDDIEVGFGSPTLSSRKRNGVGSTRCMSHDPANLFGTGRRGELQRPPPFMRDHNHASSLDHLVRSMLSPNPQDRPTVDQILQAEGIQWVAARRRAGATIFEGNWGPADIVLADDAEMMDV